MNRITLTGSITKDVEIRSTETTELITGSIAVRKTIKNTDGKYDNDFFDFTIWNPSDYLKENIKKGARVLLDGEVRISNYEDKNKVKRTKYDIFVHRAEVFTKPQEEQKEVNEFSTMHTSTDYQEKEVKLEDKDLPF